jgi:hypothetical protein
LFEESRPIGKNNAREGLPMMLMTSEAVLPVVCGG